ncbi:MAG: NAD(P)/FAD-dependent oxidoreductase [Bacteroidota bacterium]
MTRKEFLKDLAALGLGASFFGTLFSSCGVQDATLPDIEANFDGKILIIGAGAAGITAGYILQRQGIDFQIIEAAPIFGGRVKKLNKGFADFPIDLGGEWIHTDPSILATLIDDPTINASIDLVNYRPKTFRVWKDNKLKKRNIVSNFYREYKFKSTTWYDFFEQYMIPNIQDRMVYNSPVDLIDYSGDKVLVRDTNGNNYEADKVLVTVPVKIIQDGHIDFQPALPPAKVDAFNSIDFPPILKAFMKFSERFYPDMLIMDGLFIQDYLFYDAAFGKEAQSNVLGLFVIGDAARDYTDLATREAIANRIIQRLDEVFDGKASRYLEDIVVQDWTKEPFVQGSYSHFGDDYESTIETLTSPVSDKLYFAGEAMDVEGDTSTVHGASRSAYQALSKMLRKA